ncbi:cytochrome b/b6 domain-containing protein [Paracoccus luteus]|uniref:cytochrome b/b6 domain-containing protein n=1 Tax=Paracoccus luteus TaxID=2508543 RepID=UPI00106FAF0B|nr:cytochrome b/b6 domain-containing protein [Paracoccus luteus]
MLPHDPAPRGYDGFHRLLHWAIALLILSAIGLGLYASSLPQEGAAALAAIIQVFSVHKTVGVAVLLLALARIVWVATRPHPRPLHPERRLETLVADSVHWALYGGMVLMPLTGWLLHSAAPGEGFARILWPLGQRLPGVPIDAALSERFAAFHVTGWWLLAGLIAAHVAGALKHAVIDRDATLARMTHARNLPEPPPDTRRNRWLPPLLAVVLWAAVAVIAQATPEEAADGAPVAEAVDAAPAAALPDALPDALPAAASTDAVPAPAAPVVPADTPAADTAAAAVPTWTVQSGTVAISVNQAGAPVAGQFGTWTAQIAYDEATGTGSVTAVVDVTSLSLGAVSSTATGPDFLNAAANPQATFEGAITRAAQGSTAHQATGTLTIAGMTQPATLPFDLTIDGTTATARGTLAVDRRDFGVGKGYADESTAGFAVPVTVELTATRD